MATGLRFAGATGVLFGPTFQPIRQLDQFGNVMFAQIINNTMTVFHQLRLNAFIDTDQKSKVCDNIQQKLMEEATVWQARIQPLLDEGQEMRSLLPQSDRLLFVNWTREFDQRMEVALLGSVVPLEENEKLIIKELMARMADKDYYEFFPEARFTPLHMREYQRILRHFSESVPVEAAPVIPDLTEPVRVQVEALRESIKTKPVPGNN